MLTVSQAAADALDEIVAHTDGAPDGAGVRVIEAGPTPDGDRTFGMSVVEEPHPSDEVIDTGKTPVFVERDAAALLADKELDATVSEGRVGFMITERG